MELERKEKRKRLTFKGKVKRVIRIIFRFFYNIYAGIKNAYDKLNKTGKLIAKVWCVIAVIILVLLLLIGLNKTHTSKYEAFEEKMNEAIVKYYKDEEFYANEKSPIRVKVEELFDLKYLEEKDLPDSSCTGYSIVYSTDDDNTEIESKSFLNCKKYTTENYYKN
jgi:hypothetical protein